jgi:serine/threonine protein kinase
VIGQVYGPYQVLSKLGEGGMGEVYRARDSRLKRDVALKVLPPQMAGDRDRLARFQREAEVLAALNHPRIAQIYGLEESTAGGIATLALVMEIVEGEDLAERIARGAVPIDEALAIARQIAEALEAAHEKGIIHRDLKPANIKLREDGTVKVLDFGLAKALDQDPKTSRPQDLQNSPTITSPALTQAGLILGTPAYMSPEQARGKAVDTRADIWAFGCVVFEMLAGRPPFDGETTADTLATVLEREPDWQRLPDATPDLIVRLLQRCLEKDSHSRIRDIGDARIDLDDARVPDRHASPRPAGGSTRARRHNLPAELTSFVGRQNERSQLTRLLGRIAPGVAHWRRRRGQDASGVASRGGPGERVSGRRLAGRSRADCKPGPRDPDHRIGDRYPGGSAAIDTRAAARQPSPSPAIAGTG